MVQALGTDLVECARIAAVLARHEERFLSRLFSARERSAVDGDQGHRRVMRIAVRFAAKEAALKALGSGWGRGVGWHEVEVLGGRGQPPRLEFSGRARELLAASGASGALVSLTHTEHLAGATVILT